MASPRHCATWWLPDVKLSHFAGKIKPPPNHIKGLGMIRAGITVPIENKGNTTEVTSQLLKTGSHPASQHLVIQLEKQN